LIDSQSDELVYQEEKEDEMADQTSVYQSRIERARELMRDEAIDMLFIGPSADFRYFTGHPTRPSERLTALLIPHDGAPTIIVPRLEHALVADLGDHFEFEVWEETESPIDRIVNRVQKTGGEAIAINDQIWAGFVIDLQHALPNRSYHRGANILKQLRSVKDQFELDLLREASRRTDIAWEDFVKNVKVIGRTEEEVADDLKGALADNGMPDVAFCIVASGPNGSSPHHHTADRRIEAGDPIVMDFGGIYEGYYSDVTRTPVAGHLPDDDFTTAYNVVLEAQQAAFETIAPGVACQDVDRAARKVITDHGYGEYFIHRVGHGIGMTGHEDPYLVEGNEEPLQTGMVVSDEPGIYIPGKWGIRVEDSVAVTESGSERYNHVSRDITILEY
jgi:Xaa-Pro aminopeptidase